MVEVGLYQVENPIPIGKIAYIMGLTPDSSDPGYTIKTYSWSGGTNFAGYFSDNPADPPAPEAAELDVGVDKNQSTYRFIVTADFADYIIQLKVTYDNGATGTSTLDFSPDVPGGSLTVKQDGQQTYGAAGLVNVNPQIQISAKSSVDQYTAGQFMFIQIVDFSQRSYVDNTGQSWYISNTAAFPGVGGPLLDGDGMQLGYIYMYGGEDHLGSWQLPDGLGNKEMPPDGNTTPPYTYDNPAQNAQNATTNKSVTAYDEFSTYLMYKSEMGNSVWIALSEVQWDWNDTATNTGGGVWTGTTVALDPGGPMEPSGAAAFPGWVNIADAYLSMEWADQQKGP